MRCRDQLRAWARVHVDELREKNSIPRLVDLLADVVDARASLGRGHAFESSSVKVEGRP